MGPLPGQLRLTGGAARSRMLRRILGAAVGVPVRTSMRAEAGAAGAAMMAAVRIGQYKDMSGCAADWVAPLLGDIEAPDANLAEAYGQVFPAYAAAHKALRPVWAMMAERREAAQ
jgi:erythritol kinase